MSERREELTAILTKLQAEHEDMKAAAQAAHYERAAAHQRRDEALVDAASKEHAVEVAANKVQQHQAKIKYAQDALSKLGEA